VIDLEQRAVLTRLFQAGLAAADPERTLAPHLKFDSEKPPIVLAIGKAAAKMAMTAERLCPRPLRGLVVLRAGDEAKGLSLPVLRAAHPLPDAASLVAGERLLSIAERATADDHVVVLLSGGASALAAAPCAGLDLEEKRRISAALMREGATIEELNAVRRRLSRLKGGRLAAAAAPARLSTYAISDVISDRPEAIGSGPTVGDPTTIDEARAVLAKYGIAEPRARLCESVKPCDPRLANTEFRIVASAALSIAAVAEAAGAIGFDPVNLGADVEGEARLVARAHAAYALKLAEGGRRVAIVSGGELTVTVKGEGCGGPNSEYAAAFAEAIDGATGIAALIADSDGIDGNSTSAGAFIDGATAAAARAAGHPLARALDRNDTASAFLKIGAAFAPGMTGANMNDFRIILLG
jgi:hydroxypyruvate reductase